MSSIATCPQCADQFVLPEFAAADDHARCPGCSAEFTVSEAYCRKLPVAELLPPQELAPAKAETSEVTDIVSPLAEFSPELRAAETIAYSTKAMAGWEERLKRAIESTTPETADAPVTESFSSSSTILENAPDFDFHMDPPAESPADSYAAPTELPNSQAWFSEGGKPVVSHQEVSPAPPTVSRTPRRRRRKAFLQHAIAAMLFGIVGALLGQYALLWIRGPSADYMQLTQVLPNSLRPSWNPPRSFGPRVAMNDRFIPAPEPREESPVETITRQLAEKAPLPVEPPPLAPAEEPVRRDDAVQPATAEIAVQATRTTAAEFAELLAAAKSAAPSLMSGDLKSAESARAKGQAYMALCRLAERFDFAHELGLAPGAEREAADARAFLRTTAATVAQQADFAVIVTRWWQHHDRTTPGIFLTGRVADIQTVGSQTLAQVAIVLPEETTLIPVLMSATDVRVGDEIGVVGTVVADPQKALPGFPAALPQLVAAQEAFAVSLD